MAMFPELNTKEVFSNSYGSSARIDRHIHYEGSKQVCIYVKNGYGASESITYVTIPEQEVKSWAEAFKVPKPIKLVFQKPNQIMDQDPKKENSFETLRDSLFSTMKGVIAGNIPAEKAKAICMVAQTITNTVKVEEEIHKRLKSTGKPKMIS